MVDYIAISQSCPGAIAVNAAIMTGLRVRGIAGLAAAVLGTMIPPIVIISLVSVFYQVLSDSRVVSLMLRGMQAGIAAIILDVTLSLGKKVIKGEVWL